MTLKELEKHKHAVIRKHFKEEKLPNMLTYGEKQQMKRLHFDDPDLWTVDKLASSFPASPAIVQVRYLIIFNTAVYLFLLVF